jgi:hypothetical protein
MARTVRVVEPGRLEAAVGRIPRDAFFRAPRGRGGGRGRRRIVAAVVLLALSAAWLAFPRPAIRTAAIASARASSTEPVRVPRVRVESWRLPLPEAVARYRTESGATIAARGGAPACARGQPDERAWARPETPHVTSGRYRCRIESGRAAMWWTDEQGLLAHAVAADGNLAALFAWWRAQSGG